MTTRSSIAMIIEANAIMKSINRSFGTTEVVSEHREKIFRMFANEDRPTVGGWITVDYDKRETRSHSEIVVINVSVELEGELCEGQNYDLTAQEQAIEFVALYLQSFGRVDFNL